MASRKNSKQNPILDAKKLATNARFQREAKVFLENLSPESKKEVFGYLLKRLQTPNDPIRNLKGAGEYAELVIAILTGTVKTERDVFNFKLGGNLAYWAGGDLSIPKESILGDQTPAQVKTNRASINIPLSKVGVKLKLDEKGKILNPKEELIMNYVLGNPNGIRFYVPVYKTAYAGFFDFGKLSFIELVEKFPNAFRFKNNVYNVPLFKKATTEIIKEIKKTGYDGLLTNLSGLSNSFLSELSDLIDMSFYYSEKEADEKIADNIQAIRRLILHKNEKIDFNYLKLASSIAQEINPLIDTGFEKEDKDKGPFWAMLDDLFGLKFPYSLNRYLGQPYTTLGNKKSYYEHTYANILY